MTREHLFKAIGCLEETRLAASEMELSLSPETKTEEKKEPRKGTVRRFTRNLLVAAVIVSMLAVTAYAVAGWVIFDSPQTMLAAIFGDRTGYDHGDYTQVPDPERPGSLLAERPEYDRVPADTEAVAEVAPYVTPVGRQISFHGMVLTVDAFLYDSATRCGVVTYTLENGPEYYLQFNGQVDYMGRSHPAGFNQYGYHYIIEEKTTDTVLAASYYFCLDARPGQEDFFVTIADPVTYEERVAVYEKCMQQVKAQYSREEAIVKAKELLGDRYEVCIEEAKPYYDDYEAQVAYTTLRDHAVVAYWEENPIEECQEKITFDCSESRELTHRSAGEGAVTISALAITVDIAPLTFLHRVGRPVNSDLIDSIVLVYADGTEYVLTGGNVDNTLFSLNTTADRTMETEYTRFIAMFNRILDVEKIASVRINGVDLPLD